MSKRFLVVLLVLIASLAVMVPAQAQTVTDIADVYTLPAGTVVTIEGYVTVASGAFSSATFDQGFAVQDATGGVYVSVPNNLNLQANRHVRVTGTLVDIFGLRTVVDATVETLPGAQNVAPVHVATGDVGSSTLGSLITVTGTITRPVGDDQPYGYRVYIDDGSGEIQVFVHTSSGINPFVQGFYDVGRTITVTGFSGFFLDHHEVAPRSPGDVHPH